MTADDDDGLLFQQLFSDFKDKLDKSRPNLRSAQNYDTVMKEVESILQPTSFEPSRILLLFMAKLPEMIDDIQREDRVIRKR